MEDDPDLVKKAEEGIDFVKDLASSPKAPPPKGQEGVKPPERSFAEEESEERFKGAENVVADRLQDKDKNRAGCVKALGGVAAVVLIIVAVGIIAGMGRDDDDDDDDCAMGVGEVAAATQACPNPDDSPTDDTTDPGATVPPGADLTAFAGRWVLVEGFDDPTGADAGVPVSGSQEIIGLDSSSSEIVIEPDGTVSGGFFHTGALVDLGCGPEQRGDVFDEASGAVDATGKGSVTWRGPRKAIQCIDPVVDPNAGQTRQFWITGDEMIVCRSPMATATTCAAPVPEVAAVFRRA